MIDCRYTGSTKCTYIYLTMVQLALNFIKIHECEQDLTTYLM